MARAQRILLVQIIERAFLIGLSSGKNRQGPLGYHKYSIYNGRAARPADQDAKLESTQELPTPAPATASLLASAFLLLSRLLKAPSQRFKLSSSSAQNL